ncbi:Nucleotide-binding, alpha-beta plait [Moelleriella libera RCEF 2490]|uniref:Nucleotide-binding, alpha-beta plait n=1 Tax=Moelleriella libera RCEF 2490 TaxID=1081109 RepID=A0A167ZQN1_9HYPO|nr:Nucleotide-binding, alpha-beta plait [Moelleriella libera RCEF 2490]
MDSGHDPKSKGDGYTRLHITPLDLDLAKIVVPANGRNLSLHTIETFPEKRYGFVDLPSADADKLKRKLHGSTLKGVKMRIEQARSEQNQTEESKQKKGQKRSRISGTTTDDAALPSSKKHRGSSSSSSKSEIGVIEGVALHDRKVKRGWTEPVATSKKKKSKHDATATTKKTTARPRHRSKYTDQDECLLKTKLPPNAVGNLPTAERRRDKKRKRRDDGREVTVHEFEKTTKFPSFLKTVVPQTLGKPAVEFVEDKGWVDEDGELVEAVKPRAKGLKQKKGEARNKQQQQPPPAAVQEESDDETSSSGESSDEETMPPPPSKAAAGQSLEEGGSDSSSDDDTTTTVQNQSPNPLRSGTHQPLLRLQRPLSSSDAKSPQQQQQQRPLSSSSSSRNSLTIKIPPPPPATPSAASTTTTTTTNAKVHPLEALYKRSASQSAAGPSHAESQQQQQQQQFSFFDQQSDADADDAAGAAAPAVPMTPFTRADLEWRNVRSAAPTPDTAHPSSRARSSYFWGSDDYDDDEEEGEADSSSRTQIHVDARPAQQQQEKDKGHKSGPAVSDFQSLFWDNRGDLNRSWMGRRKTAAKAKRHRANKARAYRAL